MNTESSKEKDMFFAGVCGVAAGVVTHFISKALLGSKSVTLGGAIVAGVLTFVLVLNGG